MNGSRTRNSTNKLNHGGDQISRKIEERPYGVISAVRNRQKGRVGVKKGNHIGRR